MDPAKDTISSIGEFGLIRRLTKNIVLKNKSSVTGAGDDAAVLDYKGRSIVVTTDLLTEGIHFNLVYTPLKHLGYKAAVVNFSDVFAMNALPRQMLVSMALSAKFSIGMVDEIYEGLQLACERFGVDLIGGDTTSSVTGMTLSITAIGESAAEDLVYRNGARINDLICVTGNLGAAYMGLQLLERERKIFESTGSQPELAGFEYLVGRQLKPEPRGDIIQYFREQKIKPTSMIDISDGLSSELLHICYNSGKGCKIYASKIPVDPETAKLAAELHIGSMVAAMNGGEDYELLFTVSLEEYKRISEKPGISIIGHVVDESEGKLLIDDDGKAVELTAQGWNSFNE